MIDAQTTRQLFSPPPSAASVSYLFIHFLGFLLFQLSQNLRDQSSLNFRDL